jgi:AraC-like DNA-binding protein
MFYTPRDSIVPLDMSSGISLKIVISAWVEVRQWTHKELRAPYWRLYWNDSTGASIKSQGKETPLNPSRFILIPPETSFGSCATRKVRHFYVHFLTSLNWKQPEVQILKASPADLETLQRILSVKNTTSKDCLVASLVSNLLAQLPEDGWCKKNDADSRIRNAINTIETRIPTLVPVSILASDAAMNINAFIRLFRERTGLTPAHYARERRIEAACLLLHHSERSIEDIASACGFCDRYHFTHAFIRSRKISPAAFRKQLRN